MINTHTASPIRIEKIDMDQVGKGTGITRYASGMYFGGPSTVQRYLSDYQTLNAAHKRFYHNGVEVPPGAPAYDVMAFLASNRFDYAAAEVQFANNKRALTALDLLAPISKGIPAFTVDSGVCYEVQLRNVNDDDMLRWDDIAGPDIAEQAAVALYDKIFDARLEELDFAALNLEPHDSFDTLIDSCCEVAYEAAVEEGDINSSIDYDDILEVWRARVRGDHMLDNPAASDCEMLFKQKPEGSDTSWMEALRHVVNGLSLHSEMTHGDIYEHLCHVLDDAQQLTGGAAPPKQLASDFCCKELGIMGYKCNSIYGIEGSKEYVVIDPSLLNSAVFHELRHEQLAEAVELETSPAHADRWEDGPDVGHHTPRYARHY